MIYFDSTLQILTVGCAILGIIGALHVYWIWQEGRKDVTPLVMKWLGGIVLFILAGMVLKAMYE
jgi:zinc transporter ZupT